MKVFVLGATGMLGRYVSAHFANEGYDTVGTTRCFGFEAQHFEQSALSDACARANSDPFMVVNCIGAIKQKYSDPQDLFAVNGVFPVQLARFLTRYENARMLHISTDCVFSGQTSKPYTENDPCDPIDFYGQSKLLGEECRKFKNTKVIRTSIIGEETLCNVSLLNWVRSQNGGTINGFTNHIWQGVTCLEAAKFCVYKTHFWHPKLPGGHLQHLFSPVAISKHDLVQAIIDTYGLDIELKQAKAPTPINRSLGSSHEQLYRSSPIKQQLEEQKLFTKSKPGNGPI